MAEAPGARAGLHSLPSELLERIAELGFTSQCTPVYDRGDLVHQAALLACVGNAACTELAEHLFAFLSPRLGAELPGGVDEGSTAPQLKAALKQWGLPVGGSKPQLWQRLQDEVEENAPRCPVSVAVRRELSGWRRRRISQSQARKSFNATKGDLGPLQFEWEGSDSGGRMPAKMFLLEDVKALVVQQHGSWEALNARRDATRTMLDNFKQEYDRKRKARLDALHGELRSRGMTATQAEAMVANSAGSASVIWGTKSETPAPAAVDWLQRMHFATTGQLHTKFEVAYRLDTAEKSASLAQYKHEENKRARAALAALRWYASCAANLEAFQRDPTIPPCVLPELEALWRQAHP